MTIWHKVAELWLWLDLTLIEIHVLIGSLIFESRFEKKMPKIVYFKYSKFKKCFPVTQTDRRPGGEFKLENRATVGGSSVVVSTEYGLFFGRSTT